jgi:hypothetical protein
MRKEEQFVHILEKEDIRIEMDYPLVLDLAEGEQLGDALLPWFTGAYHMKNISVLPSVESNPLTHLRLV